MKETINLSGISETMIIPLYARAKESQRKHPNFVDDVAVEFIKHIDYDFNRFKNPMNFYGCQARTIIFDRETRDYIKQHQQCTIINIACGLDHRFARVDNGQINWYNIDLENIIELRKHFIPPHERVQDIACSALDDRWMNEIKDTEDVLIIAEGFLMYLQPQEVQNLIQRISARFRRVTLLIELMSQWMVEHQKIHEATQKTTAQFRWGIKQTADFVTLCPQYRMVGDYNITPVMKQYAKTLFFFISWWLTPKNNRIGKFIKITD